MDSRFSKEVLPVQKVPLSKKTKEWRETSVNAIIGKQGTGTVGRYTRKEQMGISYELYNGNFDKKDLKYITDPYDVGDSFPASPQEFNIIRPKIDLLVGEQSKRPENFLVIQTNDEAISQAQTKKKEMLVNYMMNSLGYGGEEQTPPPPEIEDYMRKDYKTIAETQAKQTISYLREKLNLRNEFLRGWKDGLISGEEIYYVGINNGEPVLRRMNPLDCDYDNNPNLESIEDGEWFVHHTLMTPAEIYDTYYDKLEEKDLDELLKLVHNAGSGKTQFAEDTYQPIIYKENITESFRPGSKTPTDGRLDIYHVVWRSFQRIGFINITDENGEEREIAVDENYKPDKGEKVDWKWVGQVWEGYRVGRDLFFGVEPVDYIDTPIDAPERQPLPYVGVIYSNTNSRNKSLVHIMKPLQYMYIVIWYRLELTIARDKGKVLNMDVTQIPKSMGVDFAKWAHYLSALGINLINPYEEGWDIPGREGGKPAAFNQIGSQDLSMMNVMGGYIELLAKIEDMIGEISGVSKARQGQIHQSSLVGNVEREVVQSSHITEPLFWKHNLAVKNSYNILLNTAKHAWKRSEKKKLQFIYDDLSRVFMDVSEDFLYSDIDIFLSDSTKEHQNLQAMKTLLQPALQAGAGLSDAAEILTSENLGDIKTKLKGIEEERAMQEQQMQEQQMQIQQQQAQMEAEAKAEENRIKEEDSIRKADTQIQVALIGAENKEGEEGFDYAEAEKLSLQREKQATEANLKRRQVDEAIRQNKAAERQRSEEISIKRKAANKPATKTK